MHIHKFSLNLFLLKIKKTRQIKFFMHFYFQLSLWVTQPIGREREREGQKHRGEKGDRESKGRERYRGREWGHTHREGGRESGGVKFTVHGSRFAVHGSRERRRAGEREGGTQAQWREGGKER